MLACPRCGETKRIEVVRFRDGRRAKVQITCAIVVHETPVVHVMDDPDAPQSPLPTADTNADPGTFWAYNNWVHRYTKIHRADCSFCQDGSGMHDAAESEAGEWIGPRQGLSAISELASRTGFDVSRCGICLG